MSLPVVGYIDRRKPDIVIGCDRGARLYSLAVYTMWRQLTPRLTHFPTLSNRLDFARLSTSITLEQNKAALELIFRQSIKKSKETGKKPNHPTLRVLFIDDWVYSGETRQKILDSINGLGLIHSVDVNFAVMCGGSANVSGRKDHVEVPWQDDPQQIGVNYSIDGYPYAVRSPQSRIARLLIQRSIHEKAKQINRHRQLLNQQP